MNKGLKNSLKWMKKEQVKTDSALKLQELVKEKIKTNKVDLKHREKDRNYQGWCAESIQNNVLQSLVDESEK